MKGKSENEAKAKAEVKAKAGTEAKTGAEAAGGPNWSEDASFGSGGWGQSNHSDAMSTPTTLLLIPIPISKKAFTGSTPSPGRSQHNISVLSKEGGQLGVGSSAALASAGSDEAAPSRQATREDR